MQQFSFFLIVICSFLSIITTVQADSPIEKSARAAASLLSKPGSSSLPSLVTTTTNNNLPTNEFKSQLIEEEVSSTDIIVPTPSPSNSPTMMMNEEKGGLPSSVKLMIGVGGIYAAFLYYGSLQEDVFRFTAEDGSQFKQAWFLQVLEAFANVVIGFIGMTISGPTKGIPLTMFGISGASQVTAKACTSLALANGLSFPIATLAKSGKMAPVMAGSLLLGGATYNMREYLNVVAIVGGTAIVSLGKKKGTGGSSSSLGVLFIVLSLVLDGVTAGFQKRLKEETAKVGVKPKPYDYMFWTNLFMCGTAVVIALGLGEVQTGVAFCSNNPEVLQKIIKFALCSAVGQSFIFYTIANFDPLILSTVTTTRKIFSVLLSIFLKGHSLSTVGWSGIGLACSGILSELQSKRAKSKPKST